VRSLRIVLAEDATLLREGLVGILERAGHEVVAAVADAEALLVYVARELPDVVVTDIRMPPTHTDEGLRAAARIRAEHPDIAVMVLSAYVAEAYVPELLDSAPGGGVGYLLKDRVANVGHSLDAVRRVAARRHGHGPRGDRPAADQAGQERTTRPAHRP
jgi:DNA-binding NarL/FixJ family response regulator